MVMSAINEDLREISEKLHFAFAAIDPPYCLMGTLNFMVLLPIVRAYSLQPPPTAADYFKEETIYAPMICLALQSVILTFIVCYIDFIGSWFR